MLGKIKKVLISLSLAASLALAPMNVYGAGDDSNTQSGSAINSNNNLCASDENTDSIETPINVTIAENYSWTVTVPDSFSLNSENTYIDSGSIELDAESVLGSKILNVKPKLSMGEDYQSDPVTMSVTKGEGDTAANVKDQTVQFTSSNTGNTGSATLEVSINESTWQSNHPGGLDDEKVAGIKYEIALTDQSASP